MPNGEAVLLALRTTVVSSMVGKCFRQFFLLVLGLYSFRVGRDLVRACQATARQNSRCLRKLKLEDENVPRESVAT